ncbi:MAG: DMT family transporter [Bacteroidales bacterium]|nr:DMT family transporter [Bacteroidales bacterium]MBN2821154.1 DMT family transporter [Bacteroidales bacterium]
MWVILAIFSSSLLGVYDLLKKGSLKNNPFLPVLFLATTTGSVLFLSLAISSRTGIISGESIIYVPQVEFKAHLLFFLKAILVGSSWFFAYMALSKLPITIVVPIRSTGPIWTIAGALLIYSERFNLYQWLGIIIAIIASYMFALAGRKEGINFKNNKWVLAIVTATILGSASSLYDKYLLFHYDRMAVQAWFSIYMFFVLLPFLLIMWVPKRKESPVFRWRWTIPAIGIVLSLADFLYFYALSDPTALIGIVSVIRRSSVIIAFTLGAIIFKEGNIKRKAIALLGILCGVILLVLGSY